MDDLTVKIMQILDVGFENPRNRSESRLSWATRFRLAYGIRKAVREHYGQRRVTQWSPRNENLESTEAGPHWTSHNRVAG